jgi:MFS family permease
LRACHFGLAPVGFLMAAGSAGSVIGALSARRIARRFGTARALLLAVLAAALFGLLIPLTGDGIRAAFYVAGDGVIAAGITVGNIILVSFRQAYTPAGMLGRTTSGQRFVAFGVAPIGALLAGALGTALGIRGALWLLLGLFALSGTVLLTPAILGTRDLPAAPPVS